jgi:hypothetical protein
VADSNCPKNGVDPANGLGKALMEEYLESTRNPINPSRVFTYSPDATLSEMPRIEAANDDVRAGRRVFLLLAVFVVSVAGLMVAATFLP